MKIIDLTIPLSEKIPVYTGDPKPKFKQIARIETHGWNEKRLTFNTHFSTHMDAPYHMIPNGNKLDEYPIEKFIGNGILVDVKDQKEMKINNPEIIQKDDIVLFCTGYNDNLERKDYFENNPVLTENTADILIERKAKMIGLDTFTPDNEPFNIHKKLLSNDILIIENLVNLDKLVNRKFDIIALPLKLENADGSPARVIAILK